jgi:signal transduction histidine kinase
MNQFFLFILLAILSISQNSYSQIQVRTSYYLDAKSQLVISEVKNESFTYYQKDLLKGFSDDTVWIKLEISKSSDVQDSFNQMGEYPLILRVGSLSLDSVELFEYDNESLSYQQLGDRHMRFPRLCEDEVHCFNLKSILDQPATLYLRIQSQNIIQIHTEVIPQKELSKSVSPHIRTSSISLAFGFCLGIVAFIFYLIERSKLILYYVFFQIAIIFYLIASNGLLFDIVKGNYSEVLKYAPEFFFYLRALLLCLLSREIFIGYEVNNSYKVLNKYLLSLLSLNVLLTFFNLGHKNAAFNIFLQTLVLTLNFYAILTTNIPKRIKYSAFIGNAIYSTILISGFLYASHLLNSNRFDFLIHDYLDYRLNGIPIGIVIFSIVTFQIIEKNKKNQEIVNQATSSALKIDILNEKLIEQEEMVDLLTHEIKNPLNTISYAVKYLQNDSNSNFEMIDRTKKIVHSVSRIDSIVNQVYLSTRLERYEQSGHDLNEIIIFNELLFEVVSDYEFGNAFSINTDKIFKIYSSRFLLNSILTNLIGNAVKYSTYGSVININLRTTNYESDSGIKLSTKLDSHLIFEIVNTFDRANIPDPEKLFKRYYRHANFLSKPGMGIGLNIVKTAINILRGSISFHIEFDQITFKTEIPL